MKSLELIIVENKHAQESFRAIADSIHAVKQERDALRARVAELEAERNALYIAIGLEDDECVVGRARDVIHMIASKLLFADSIEPGFSRFSVMDQDAEAWIDACLCARAILGEEGE